MDWSAEQEAKTEGSEGLHWRSSTDEVWVVKGCDKGINPAWPVVVR